MPQFIESNEGTVSESVTTKHQVRAVEITPDAVTFYKRRVKEVGGVTVRVSDGTNVSRHNDDVLLETVTHGGNQVSWQNALTIVKKFHDKWAAEDAG